MKLATKLVLGSALALAATHAFAQVAVPPGAPYNGAMATGANASAFLTLFSTNDLTPFSYEYNLGLKFNDLLASNGMNTPGLTLTWNISGLSTAVPGTVAATDLAFDVTATSQGAGNPNTTAGVYRILTTVDPTVTAAAITAAPTVSSDLAAVQSNSNTFITNLNATSTNPRTTTTVADPTYANANYGITLNQFGFNAGAGVSTALNFFQLTSGAGNNSAIGISQYAGTWTINLAAGTLTYSVAGGAPVPLPAALWLLMSGLAGIGVVGRRKSAVPVDALAV
jgi:hypothetical protein